MKNKFIAFFMLISLIVTQLPSNTFAQGDVVQKSTVKFKVVDAGDGHVVALKADGTVVAWGENNMQQCDIPPEIMNIKRVISSSFTIVVKEDNSIMGFGENKFFIPSKTSINTR